MEHRDEEARLKKFYEELTGERLIALAGKPGELTPLAQELLHAEMRARRLHVSPTPQPGTQTGFDSEYTGSPQQPRGERQIWYAEPGGYAALAPAECSFPMSDQNVHAMQTSLALAGIPHDAFWPRHTTDLRAPYLAVLPEDRDRARAILTAPVSDLVKSQMQAEEEDPDDWSPPACPQCSAPDALLVSVDPTNVWCCEECGHSWQDPTSVEKR